MQKIILFGIVSILAACSQPDARVEMKNDFNMELIRAHINEANTTYDSRFTNGSIEHYNKMYCADACIMPERTEKICDPENILKQYYYNGNNKSFKLNIVAENIYGSKEVVVEEGKYDFMDSTGRVLDNGKFIALWKFENDTLKMFREIWNSNLKAEK